MRPSDDVETLYAAWRAWLLAWRPTVAALQGDVRGLGRLDPVLCAAEPEAAAELEQAELAALAVRAAALPEGDVLARVLRQRLAWSRLEPALMRRRARPDQALDWASEALNLALGFAGLPRGARAAAVRRLGAECCLLLDAATRRALAGAFPDAHDRRMADWAAADLAGLYADTPAGAEVARGVRALRRALRNGNGPSDPAPARSTSFRCGEALLAAHLREVEFIDTPLAQLSADFEAGVEAARDALAAAAARVFPGRTVRGALSRLEADRPTARGLLREARACVAELRSFTLEAGFVTLDAPDLSAEGPAPSADGSVCRVAAAPAYLRALAVACLDVPGPWQSTPSPACYYLASPLPGEPPEQVAAALRTFNRPRLAWVSAHETYPGHLVEHLHRPRAAHELLRVADSEVFIEGWACYAEGLLVSHGFRDADPRIAQGVAWARLLREVRAAAALRLHAGDTPLAEVERLFRQGAVLSPAEARREALRAACEPTVLTYALGRRLIEARKAAARARPGFDERAFHDELLSWGTMPLGARPQAV